MRTVMYIAMPAIVLLAVACEHATPDLVAPELRFSTTAASRSVPLKGHFVWQAAPAELARCLAGEGGANITKVGHATHLGPFTASSSHCFNPATGQITQGESVYTAANGDELWARYTGQVSGSGPVLRVDLSPTIIGGTGRFAGSSGTLIVVADFDPATGSGTATMSGLLSSSHSK